MAIRNLLHDRGFWDLTEEERLALMAQEAAQDPKLIGMDEDERGVKFNQLMDWTARGNFTPDPGTPATPDTGWASFLQALEPVQGAIETIGRGTAKGTTGISDLLMMANPVTAAGGIYGRLTGQENPLNFLKKPAGIVQQRMTEAAGPSPTFEEDPVGLISEGLISAAMQGAAFGPYGGAVGGAMRGLGMNMAAPGARIAQSALTFGLPALWGGMAEPEVPLGQVALGGATGTALGSLGGGMNVAEVPYLGRILGMGGAATGASALEGASLPEALESGAIMALFEAGHPGKSHLQREPEVAPGKLSITGRNISEAERAAIRKELGVEVEDLGPVIQQQATNPAEPRTAAQQSVENAAELMRRIEKLIDVVQGKSLADTKEIESIIDKVQAQRENVLKFSDIRKIAPEMPVKEVRSALALLEASQAVGGISGNTLDLRPMLSTGQQPAGLLPAGRPWFNRPTMDMTRRAAEGGRIKGETPQPAGMRRFGMPGGGAPYQTRPPRTVGETNYPQQIFPDYEVDLTAKDRTFLDALQGGVKTKAQLLKAGREMMPGLKVYDLDAALTKMSEAGIIERRNEGFALSEAARRSAEEWQPESVIPEGPIPEPADRAFLNIAKGLQELGIDQAEGEAIIAQLMAESAPEAVQRARPRRQAAPAPQPEPAAPVEAAPELPKPKPPKAKKPAPTVEQVEAVPEDLESGPNVGRAYNFKSGEVGRILGYTNDGQDMFVRVGGGVFRVSSRIADLGVGEVGGKYEPKTVGEDVPTITRPGRPDEMPLSEAEIGRRYAEQPGTQPPLGDIRGGSFTAPVEPPPRFGPEPRSVAVPVEFPSEPPLTERTQRVALTGKAKERGAAEERPIDVLERDREIRQSELVASERRRLEALERERLAGEEPEAVITPERIDLEKEQALRGRRTPTAREPSKWESSFQGGPRTGKVQLRDGRILDLRYEPESGSDAVIVPSKEPGLPDVRRVLDRDPEYEFTREGPDNKPVTSREPAVLVEDEYGTQDWLPESATKPVPAKMRPVGVDSAGNKHPLTPGTFTRLSAEPGPVTGFLRGHGNYRSEDIVSRVGWDKSKTGHSLFETQAGRVISAPEENFRPYDWREQAKREEISEERSREGDEVTPEAVDAAIAERAMPDKAARGRNTALTVLQERASKAKGEVKPISRETVYRLARNRGFDSRGISGALQAAVDSGNIEVIKSKNGKPQYRITRRGQLVLKGELGFERRSDIPGVEAGERVPKKGLRAAGFASSPKRSGEPAKAEHRPTGMGKDLYRAEDVPQVPSAELWRLKRKGRREKVPEDAHRAILETIAGEDARIEDKQLRGKDLTPEQKQEIIDREAFSHGPDAGRPEAAAPEAKVEPMSRVSLLKMLHKTLRGMNAKVELTDDGQFVVHLNGKSIQIKPVGEFAEDPTAVARTLGKADAKTTTINGDALIEFSNRSDETTVRHEFVHVADAIGAIKPVEFKALTNRFAKREQKVLDTRKLTAEQREEWTRKRDEAIADGIEGSAAYRKNIYQRIAFRVRELGQWLKNQGYEIGFVNERALPLTEDIIFSLRTGERLNEPLTSPNRAVGEVRYQRRPLAEEAPPETRTDEFREFYRDSVIRDKNGNPKVVYTGRSPESAMRLGERGTFAKSQSGAVGAWFTPNPEYAEIHGDALVPAYVAIKRPFTGRIGAKDATEYTYDKQFVSWLRKNGYDGVISVDGEAIVPLNPEQVKSVFNKGTWNPSDERYLHQRRPLEADIQAAKEFARDVKEGGEKTWRDLANIWNPLRKVPEAMKEHLFRMVGEPNRLLMRAQAATRVAYNKSRDMSTEQLAKVRDAWESGQSTGDADLDAAIKTAKVLSRAEFEDAKKIRGGSYREFQDYLTHMWKREPTGPRWEAAKRRYGSLTGSEKFFEDRIWDNYKEGIANGGVPLYDNPFDVFYHHLSNISKFNATHRMLNNGLKDGTIRIVKNGEKPPEGFEKVPGVKQARNAAGDKLGDYYTDKHTATALKNYLSRDLIRAHPAGRAIMGIKNFTTGVELGLSGFHLAFIGQEAISSSIARAARRAVNLGDFSGAAKEAAHALISPGTEKRLGRQILEYAQNPEEFKKRPEYQSLVKRIPDLDRLVDDMFDAGAKIGIDESFKSRWYDEMKRAWRDQKYVGAVLKAAPAVIEKPTEWLFEKYVPQVKIATFAKEYLLALEENAAKIESGQTTRGKVARDTWKFVEDRFGQMNYDTLFWNKTAKTTAQLMFRSVTWKLGNIRAMSRLLGSAARAPKELVKSVKDKTAPEITPEAAWLFGSLMFVGMTGAIIQKAATGKDPEGIRDLLFPRIDRNDDTQRVVLPSYLKDWMHIAPVDVEKLGHGEVDFQPEKMWHYARSSMSGLITKLGEDFYNEDYFGNKIVDERDPEYKKLYGRIKHLFPQPISISSGLAQLAEGKPEAALGSLVGITKAPAVMSQTPAEHEMRQRLRENMPSRTPDEREAGEQRYQLMRRMRQGELPEKPADMTNSEYARLMKRVGEDPEVSRFKRLGISDAEDVWNLMTRDERARFKEALLRKLYARLSQGVDPAVAERLMEAMRKVQSGQKVKL